VKLSQRGLLIKRCYATNGHVFDRDISPLDSICGRYMDNGGKLDEDDAETLRVAIRTTSRGGRCGGKMQITDCFLRVSKR
jgi:hypothetical protein